MGVNALYAAVFAPGLDRLELSALPSRHRQEPDYLGVLRVLDIPETAALAEKLDASRGTIGSQVRRLLDERLAVVVDKQGNAWGFPIEAHSVAGYRAAPEIRYLVTGR